MKAQFYYCHNELGRNSFNRYGLFFSQQFCEFFTERFTQLFFNETGLKPSSKVTLAGYKQNNDVPIFQSGSVSKLNLVLWIMPEYNDNISFCWRSKTGKIIMPADAEFDEADLQCWFENLKPSEYWKQVATEKKYHPFNIKNLPFEVKVFDFGVEMEMRFLLSSLEPLQNIEKIVSDTIELYNKDSENNNRNKGVVHNFKILNEEDKLIFRIDTGSAGVNIINDILKAIRKIDEIKSVELDL